MIDIRNRVAVVTGGASGIGRACVERLEALGARPAGWDLAGGEIACDVADAASVEAAMRATLDRFGPPTLLIACAGVASHGPIIDIEPQEWDRALGVNLRGVMLSVQAVARSMLARGLGGAMVLVSSINGQVAEPGTSTYSAAKAGVHHLARVAAREFGPHGVRVNAVGPGPTETPMLADALQDPAYRAEVLKRTPLRAVGSPALVAEAIVGVLQMEWVTGQVIMADGGASLTTARSAWQAPESQ